MAYRRSSSRRRANTGGRYSTRSAGRRTYSRKRTGRTRRSVTAQTLRIVVEQIPATAVSRAIGPVVATETKKPGKAKF